MTLNPLYDFAMVGIALLIIFGAFAITGFIFWIPEYFKEKAYQKRESEKKLNGTCPNCGGWEGIVYPRKNYCSLCKIDNI
jgi:hypothetical protein